MRPPNDFGQTTIVPFFLGQNFPKPPWHYLNAFQVAFQVFTSLHFKLTGEFYHQGHHWPTPRPRTITFESSFESSANHYIRVMKL